MDKSCDMPHSSQLQMVGAKLLCLNDAQPSSIDSFENAESAANKLSLNAGFPTHSLNQPTKSRRCRDGTTQAISQRNLEVLENAFVFAPAVTADQALFLGQSINLEPEMVKQWFEHRHAKGPAFEITSRRRVSDRVAQWKRKIIDQGLSAIQDPTRDQLAFLAAGLNLTYEQIHKLLLKKGLSEKPSHLSSDFHDTSEASFDAATNSSGASSTTRSMLTTGTTITDFSTDFDPFGYRGKCNDHRSLNSRYPLRFTYGSPFEDSWANKNTESANDFSPFFKLIRSSSHSISGDEFFSKGMEDTNDAKSAVKYCDESKSVIETRQSSIPITVQEPDAESNLNESFEQENNTELLSDECESLHEDEGLEWRIASILGQEYAHLAAPLLERWSSEQDLSQCASGTDSGNTPSSESSGAPGSTSATKTPITNTSLSETSSSKKRKFDSNVNNGDKANDEGEDDPPKRPKIEKVPRDPKVPKPQWDCILFKIDPFKHSECGMSSFPFRHLWQHLERSHLMCQSCGKKLRYNDALKHLIEARENVTGCGSKELNMRDGVDFIGISTFTKLNDIYREKISDLEKWEKWWGVLSSGPVPDPTHDEMITILTSKIPATIEDARKLWDAEIESGNLKDIDKDEQNAILKLLGMAIQLSPVLQKKPRQPRTVASRSNAGNVTSMNDTTAWVSGADPFTGSGSMWNNLDQYQSLDLGNYDPINLINGPGISQTPEYGGSVTDPRYDLSRAQIPGYDSASASNLPRNMDMYGYEGNNAGGN